MSTQAGRHETFYEDNGLAGIAICDGVDIRNRDFTLDTDRPPRRCPHCGKLLRLSWKVEVVEVEVRDVGDSVSGVNGAAGWIDVSDRLPPDNEGVLVAVQVYRDSKSYLVCLAYRVEEARVQIDKPNAGLWRVLYVTQEFDIKEFSNGSWPYGKIKYWMPVPEPPEIAATSGYEEVKL